MSDRKGNKRGGEKAERTTMNKKKYSLEKRNFLHKRKKMQKNTKNEEKNGVF